MSPVRGRRGDPPPATGTCLGPGGGAGECTTVGGPETGGPEMGGPAVGGGPLRGLAEPWLETYGEPVGGG